MKYLDKFEKDILKSLKMVSGKVKTIKIIISGIRL
jgi:hypothetical protein